MTLYISEEYTSSTCPLCRRITETPRGRIFRCPYCGYSGDRHIVAAINMALKPGPEWLNWVSRVVTPYPKVTRIRVDPKISPEETLNRVLGTSP